VNTAMNLRVQSNFGKVLSSCVFGGFSWRAQLHEVWIVCFSHNTHLAGLRWSQTGLLETVSRRTHLVWAEARMSGQAVCFIQTVSRGVACNTEWARLLTEIGTFVSDISILPPNLHDWVCLPLSRKGNAFCYLIDRDVGAWSDYKFGVSSQGASTVPSRVGVVREG
jgi:hypothetical protein